MLPSSRPKTEQSAAGDDRSPIDRLSFLARASAALASTLDYEATLRQVARLAVPFVSDWCSVDVLTPEGRVIRLASAHFDPEKEALAGELRARRQSEADPDYGAKRVMRTGVSEIYTNVDDELIRREVGKGIHADDLIKMGVTSAMVVPMLARGRTLGAMTFIADRSKRHFDERDLALAEDLAGRAASAIDNARLYEEAQDAVRIRDEALDRHRKSEQQLMLIVEATNSILESLDVNAVLPKVLTLSRELIAADAYAVWKYHPTAGWNIVVSHGLTESFLEDSRELPGTAPKVIGGGAMTSSPIAAEDVQNHPMLESRRQLYQREGIRSLLAVPLRIHGEISGTIVFYFRAPRGFDSSDIQAASALANIAATALGAADLYSTQTEARATSERAESSLSAAAAEAALLYRAGKLLGSTLDTRRIYTTLRELVAEIMDCDGFFISSYGAEDQLIRCAYAWVEGQPVDPSAMPAVPLAPEGKGMQSQVIRTGKPMVILDMEELFAQSHTLFHINPDGSFDRNPSEDRPQTQSIIYAPIKLEGQVLGTVQVQSVRKNAYTPDHLRMLDALMLQVAAAGRNAFLYQQARAELAERKRAEEEIARKQADIESLNERLQRAMTETHHRVKNNLQIIAAMVDMQLMDEPETVPASHVRRLASYVMTLAAVHDTLTQESKDDSRAQFASARAVLDKLIPLMEKTAEGRQITANVDDVRVSAKQGTAIALAVNELVNNSFKHGGSRVEIIVGTDDDNLRLEVSDDGPGFPDEFDPLSAASTGLELVESLSRWDLQGAARYDNCENGGARVTIIAPLLSEADAPMPPPIISGPEMGSSRRSEECRS